jgi:hypothetical protein
MFPFSVQRLNEPWRAESQAPLVIAPHVDVLHLDKPATS